MTSFALSGLLIALSCTGLSLWIYCRAPRKLLNNLMVLFNACVAVWGLGCMWAGLAKTPSGAIWAWRLAHLGGFPLGMTFFHISEVLCERQDRRHVIWTYAFAVLAALLCLTGFAMTDTQWLFGSLHYYRANALYVALLGTWIGIVVVGHKRLFQASLRVGGLKRAQLRIVCFAFATGFIGGISALLPFIGVQLYPYGNFSIPIYTLIISYSILKYGVTEMQLTITRAGLLLGIYFVVLGVPFVVGKEGREVFERLLGENWWLLPLGISTVLATAGPFAYAYLRSQAEAKLLKEQRRYQGTLQRAAKGMTQIRNLSRLAELITRVISRAVRVSHASLFLREKTQQAFRMQASHGPQRLAVKSQYRLAATDPLIVWVSQHQRTLQLDKERPTLDPRVIEQLEHLGASVVIPGAVEERVIGLLVLGPKLSGDPYSSDDLHAFTMLTHEAAMAIENANSYEELKQANEQLKSAAERMARQERLAAAGQFAAGMAHEIKNPLSAIKTFAQYLPEKYGDADFREKFFRIVQAEIDRIGGIVRDLLDFAKPAPPQLGAVQIGELIDDTLALLSSQCMSKHVELRNECYINGLCVQADAQQLKQVLLNLLLNGLEAMPSGGVLRVAGAQKERSVLVTVEDSGLGMPPEVQAKVWDPFFTTKERGMGLGLAIVKGIIERHGGEITLSSLPGQGTTVQFTLPLSA